MKKTPILFAFTASLFIYSCNQGTNKDPEGAADSLALSNTCYTAVFEKDTARLKVQTDTKGKITGELTFKYGELKPNALEKAVNVGTVAGNFRGDTLFVDYTHTSGSINKKGFKNPLAFLKVGENLILGVGDIETHLGRSYFVTGKPINFEIARFRFVPVDCED
jgi:hypothetical protein